MNGLEELLERLVRRVVREEVRAALGERGDAGVDQVELVTVKAFAAKRSLGISTVREMILDGRLAGAVKVGRALRVPANAAIGAPVRTRSAAAETADQWAARVVAKRGTGT